MAELSCRKKEFTFHIVYYQQDPKHQNVMQHKEVVDIEVYMSLMYVLMNPDVHRVVIGAGNHANIDVSYQAGKCQVALKDPVKDLTDWAPLNAQLKVLLDDVNQFRIKNMTVEEFHVVDGGQLVDILRNSEIGRSNWIFVDRLDEISKDEIVIVAFDNKHEKEISIILKEYRSLSCVNGSRTECILKRHQLHVELLEEIKILNSVQTQFPYVTFEIIGSRDENEVTIKIAGKGDDVKKAEQALEVYEKKFKVSKFTLVQQVDIFLYQNIARVLKDEFEKRRIDCCWRVVDDQEPQCLEFCGTKSSIESARQAICRIVIEEKIGFNGALEKLVNSPHWDKVIRKIGRSYDDTVKIGHNGRDTVLVTGLNKNVKDARIHLEKIAKRGVQDDDIDNEDDDKESEDYFVENHDHFAYMTKIKMEDLKGIASSLNMTLLTFESGNHQGFHLEGCRENIVAMKRHLDAFEHICVDYTDLGGKYFASDGGNTFLDEVEETCSVLLEKMPLAKGTGFVRVWPVQGGMRVMVKRTALEESGADVIAEAFETSRADGDFKLEKKADVTLMQFPLPMWLEGKASSQKLNHNLTKLFSHVNELKFQSVALELSSLKSWSLEKFVKVVFSSLRTLEGTQSPCLTVILCDKKADTIQECCKRCDENVSSGELPSQQMTGAANSSKTRIEVITGNLEMAQVNVIVCTVSGDLDLKRGLASRALLEAAGDELQYRLIQLYPNMWLPTGTIAMTAGYGLPCDRILFGSMEHFDERLGVDLEEFVRDNVDTLMRDCLGMADKYRATSIAFPAIGLGGLRYPLEVVAEQMFSSADTFLCDNPGTSIQLIQFIIYHEAVDAYSVFKNHLHKYNGSKAVQSTQDDQPPCWRLKIIGTADEVDKAKQHVQDRAERVQQSKPQNKNPSNQMQKSQRESAHPGNPSTSFRSSGAAAPQSPRGAQGDAQSKQKGNQSLGGSRSEKASSKVGKSSPAAHQEDVNLPTGDTLKLLKFFQKFDLVEKYTKKKCDILVGANILHVTGEKSVIKSLKDELKKASEKLNTLQNVTFQVEDGELAKARIKELRDTEVCCIYHEADKEVVFYAKTYKQAQAASHRLKVALGKASVTDRASRNLDTSANMDMAMANINIGSQASAAAGGSSGSQHDYNPDKYGARPKMHQPSKPNGKNMKTYETKEKMTVYVYTADILYVHTDCIVNAANVDLQHGGGIARVISRAAGRELDREGQTYIRKHGFLSAGGVCSTTAGQLPYNCVIHAVGPCWSDYTPHTKDKVDEVEKDLYNAIYGSFVEAEKRGMRSIAVPAVSSAIYGCPKDLCTVQYARAVVEYSRDQRSTRRHLQEIHFIDRDDYMVRLIQETFQYMIPSGQEPPTYDKKVYVKKLTARGAGSGDRFSNPSSNIPRTTSTGAARTTTTSTSSSGPYPFVTTSTKAGHEFICKLSERQSLLIYTGDLLSLTGIDMVACSDSVTGKKVGAVNKLLVKDGGIAYEKQKNVQMGIQPPKAGDVLVSGAGRNPKFKYVAHVYLYQKGDTKGYGDRMGKIKQMFVKLVEACKQKNCKTLALPLLGTGEGSAKPDEYLERFFEGLLEFCKQNKQYSLTVHLVNIDDWKTTKAVYIVNKMVDAAKQSTVPASPSYSLGQDSNKGTKRPGGGGGRGSSSQAGAGRGGASRAGGDMGSSVHRRGSPSGASVSGSSSPRKTQNPSGTSSATLSESDPCAICMETKMKQPKTLPCGHTFCTRCIEQYFTYKEVCPTCGAICGIITGDQPKGTIQVTVNKRSSCAGYAGCGRIEITYAFPDGTQGADHPHPGKRYKGIQRTCYLPDNARGRQVRAMLEVAFKRKLVFTIGSSRTTGKEGVITWNDIHHKTNPLPNSEFGYPDPDYLDRVTDELAAKGVTERDIK